MSETEVGGIDSTRLKSLIERIERLEEEKKYPHSNRCRSPRTKT